MRVPMVGNGVGSNRLACGRLHDLRHNFASFGAASGMGLPVIGALLGHREVRTTARYAHLADDPLRAASEAIAGQVVAALDGGAPSDVLELRKRK